MRYCKLLSLLGLILASAHYLNAAAVTLTFEGTCSYSGSSGAIAQGESVTVVVELDGTTVSATDSDPNADFASLSTYRVSVATPLGYTGSFNANPAGSTVTLQPHLSSTIFNCFADDNTGGLPGISDTSGAIVFLSVEMGAVLPGNTDGVTLVDLLGAWPQAPAASGSISLEPSWNERVDIQVNSATVQVDGGTPLNVPPGLSDSQIAWPDDPTADGWYYSAWFGYFYYTESYGDRVWSDCLGSVYFDPDGSPSGVWIWSDILDSWIWGSAGNGLWYYHWNDQNWIYMENYVNGGCWIFWESLLTWYFYNPYS